MGKTTFVQILAIEWATRVRSELDQFDIVFTIPLRDVKPHHKLEELIAKHHRRLKYNRVQTRDLADILNGPAGRKVLMVLDGYDEYTPGTLSLCSVFFCSANQSTFWCSPFCVLAPFESHRILPSLPREQKTAMACSMKF